MGHRFDPYHTWLGIPSEDQPPHHYRLLGLEPLESDREVIVNAVNQRTAHVQSKQTGPHATEARELLAKIAAARVCLLSPDKKEEYDTALRHGIGKRTPAQPAGPAKQKIKTAQPLPTAKPLTAAKPAAHKPQQPAPAKPAAAPAESAQPARKPRFKSEPEPAAAVPTAPLPAPPVPTPVPAAPVTGGTSPQIVAEGSPRYRRKKSSWLGPVVVLMSLIAGAGAAVGVAYYLGILPLGGPQVAVNTNDRNGDPAAGNPDGDETIADEADTPETGTEGSPATTADSSPAEKSPTDAAPNLDGEAAVDSSSDSADANEGTTAVPNPDELAELTDEPWAGMFDDKPAADGADPPPPSTGDTQPALADAANQESQRWPVPSPEAQDEAKAVVRRIFHDDISAARTSEARVVLAQKLIAYAEQTKKDPAARYTLLALARDLAAYAGESLLILQTVDQLAREYEIDPLEMKADTFQLAGRSAPTAQVLAGVMETARKLIGQAVRESRYEIAVDLGEMCLTGARRLRSRDLVTECSILLKDINTRKVRYEFAQRAKDTLNSNPDDPEANLALGKYLVITDRNWKKGLPHLAKGSEDRLAEVANLELSDLADPRAKVALADLWEKLSLANRGGEEEPLYRSRSIHWLQQALPQLDGLEKIATAKKLEELGAAVDLTAAAPSAPIAPEDDGLSTIEAPDDGKTSDADLLDALAAPPAAGTPPKKNPPTKPPAATPEPAKEPAKTTPKKPADPPDAPSSESVEDFFGPRPPQQEEDDGGSGFFGD